VSPTFRKTATKLLGLRPASPFEAIKKMIGHDYARKEKAASLAQIIHESLVINVREADDLKIAQHFSAGKRRVQYTKARETGDRNHQHRSRVYPTVCRPLCALLRL